MSGSPKQSYSRNNLVNIFISKFLPFWPLILAFVLLCLLSASVYIFFSKTYYESSAALLISDEEKGVDDSEMIESINFFKTKKIVENELEVISSKELIKNVVENLSLYVPMFEESLFRTKTAYETSPVRVKFKDPYVLSNSEEGNDQEYQFTFNERRNLVILRDKTYPIDQWVLGPFGRSDIKFVNNPNYIPQEDAKSFYFRTVDPRIITQYIHENLVAGTSSKLSTVVRLKYIDEVPKLGEDILSELISTYKMSAVQDRNAIAENTLKFIEVRMEEVGEELEKVEKELENYRAEEGVIDLSKQGNLYLQNVGEYDRRLADINIQLSILNKIKRYVSSKGSNSGIVPSTMGVNDPILSQLLKDLYDAEIEYANLRKTTAENNPMLSSIRNRIEEIRPSITEIINNLRANLLTSRNNLSTSSGKYNEALQILPEQERKLIEITRRKESVSSLFDYLVQKREETALSYAPASNDVKIVESPQSTLNPVSPKKSLIYFMALCVALGISITFIGAREFISTKVLFRSDLEKYTDLPVIGELAYVGNEEQEEEGLKAKSSNLMGRINNFVFAILSKMIPSHKRKEESLKDQHEDLYVADQFRQVLSFLGFYNRTNTVKKLMITSSIQGEGKSYVSANLAKTLALTGNRVALLDMDLRNREISGLFRLDKEKGLSNFLEEKNTYEQMLKKIDGYQSLFVLPAGLRSLNSSELLISKNIDILFSRLENDFDYILIDTPPINLVSDAQTLNHFCDRTLMVIRHAFTPKFVLEHLDENIKAKGFKNCSVIFNGVKERGMVSYDYGYGYGYQSKVSYNNVIENKKYPIM